MRKALLDVCMHPWRVMQAVLAIIFSALAFQSGSAYAQTPTGWGVSGFLCSRRVVEFVFA